MESKRRRLSSAFAHDFPRGGMGAMGGNGPGNSFHGGGPKRGKPTFEENVFRCMACGKDSSGEISFVQVRASRRKPVWLLYNSSSTELSGELHGLLRRRREGELRLELHRLRRRLNAGHRRRAMRLRVPSSSKRVRGSERSHITSK